ncbi:MAG: hypothetical protein PHN32_07030 [Actinomycetota bacterium]|jgi:hypothetical protein|nr:hypothetical protein [Actinomycetota bacterium]
MGSLQIVGILFLLLIGSIIIGAAILLFPVVRLIKKYKELSNKLENQLLPLAGQLKESSARLNKEMEAIPTIKADIEEKFLEVRDLLEQIRKMQKNPLRQFMGSSFELISMFNKGRQDE